MPTTTELEQEHEDEIVDFSTALERYAAGTLCGNRPPEPKA